MQNIRKCLCLLLCGAILCGTVGFGVSALDADENWQAYFSDYMQDGSAIYIAPGADETERNIAWYSPADAGACRVIVSEHADFSGARTFTGTCVPTPEGDRRNRVTVTSLWPGKTYYYKCVTDDAESSAATFTTLSGSDFTALYVTDIHVSLEDDENSLVNQSYTYSRVLSDAAQKTMPDLIVSAGDQATKGYRSEYTALTAAPLMRSIPFAFCVGNHDRKGIAYKTFTNNPNEYTQANVHALISYDYWYVKGDVLFLVFDSNVGAMTAHRNFVRDAVRRNPDVKWRIAVFHHDLYGGRIPRRESENELLRRIWAPIFDEFQIDLALLGHSHFFTITNAMYNNRTNETLDMSDGATVTDPKGTIVMVSGSINHPRIIDETEEEPPIGEHVAYYTYTGYSLIYNLLDCTEDSITVRSYTLGKRQPFHTFTIEKSSALGGHEENGRHFGNAFIRLISDVYGWINELVTTQRLLRNQNDLIGK